MKVFFTANTIWQIFGTDFVPMVNYIGNWDTTIFPSIQDIEQLKNNVEQITLSVERDGTTNVASTQDGYKTHGSCVCTKTYDTRNINYNVFTEHFIVDVSDEWIESFVNEYNSYPGKEYTNLEDRIKDVIWFFNSINKPVGDFRWKNNGSAWEIAAQKITQ